MTLPKGARFDLRTGQWSIPGQPGPNAGGRVPINVSYDGGRTFLKSRPAGAQLGGLNFPDEAKGKLAEGERGAIMAPLMKGMVTGESTSIEVAQGLSAEVVKHALLFNERIEIPLLSNFPAIVGFDFRDYVHDHAVQAVGSGCELEGISFAIWERQEAVDPGRWTIWHDSDVEPIPPRKQDADLGLRLRLQDALIVPHRDVPIEELLAFRDARSSELRALRIHLEEVALKIIRSGGDPREANLEVDRFRQSLDDYLAVARGANWRKSVLGLDIKFDVGEAAKSAFKAFPAAGAAWSVGSALLAGLGTAGAALMGGLKVERTFGAKSASGSAARPFAYVASIARDL